jgi:hypothetical protein
MKAFLILEDGTVFKGTSIGSTREVISEIVFNTSMTGYLEVLTDPSYAGQAVTMTYPLIGNYGICYKDMESEKAWPDGFIVRELSRMPSNFRNEAPIQKFLLDNDIPGICGIDTRALTKILREKGTMNGMITTNENYNLDEVLPKIKEYKVAGVVRKVTCKEKYVLNGDGPRVALMDFGAKKNIAKSLNDRGCEVTVYPAYTKAEEILASPDGTSLTTNEGAQGSPIFSIVSLNISLSSAFLIVSAVVPISCTLFSSRKPVSAISIARLRPACPPSVGKMLSGFSFNIICFNASTVRGSIYTSSAISLSVMIVAGLELTRHTSIPSSLRERQACVPA